MTSGPRPRLIDPVSAAFLMAEDPTMPMHVAGLQVFESPADAEPDPARSMLDQLRDAAEVDPLFTKHPVRGWRTGGLPAWAQDEAFELSRHVRGLRVPAPGRARELLALSSRLHEQRLAWDHPMWRAWVLGDLRGGVVGVHTAVHHSLLDGVAAIRYLQSALSTDPWQRHMPAPWAALDQARRTSARSPQRPEELTWRALRIGMGAVAEAAGMPAAISRSFARARRNETSPVSLHVPRAATNRPIGHERRVAADAWPFARLKAIDTVDTTLNDVLLTMCAGAMRRYLLELGRLPDQSLVAMVPVGLAARRSHLPSRSGGNALGSVMVRLRTDLADPAARLLAISRSMTAGKAALSSLTPAQILAVSAVGQIPAILVPLLGLQDHLRPAYNLLISNIPGPPAPLYLNGWRMLGFYPLSIPINGMGLSITFTSYADLMCVGIVGCRRCLPHLQRILHHLHAEVADLERAAGR